MRLNDRQQEAALKIEGPVLILAGAGSGKTRVLTARITHMIRELRVPPFQVLAVTFTNKAAGEMRERVNRELQGDTSIGVPEIGTFHSVCTRILRREAAQLPFKNPFVIFDDSDQSQLVKQVMKKLEISDKVYSANRFQYAINGAKCDGKGPEDLDPNSRLPFDRFLVQVYREYQRELYAHDAMDFGELLFATVKLFRENPEVLHKYQNRFKYVHVDEYQDTNRVQYDLLTLLTHPRFGGNQNLCVVGDEDQSIYKWRGADIRNILDFEKDFPGAAVVKLEQNYRSSKNIVEAATAMISHNSQRKQKTLWTENDAGALIELWELNTEREESEEVVREILKLVGRDPKFALDQVAVFYRTHAQSRSFEDLFRRERLPYQIVAGLRFYERKEIKDILSYFKLLVNPKDDLSFKRVIQSPSRGIGKTTIEKLEEIRNQFHAEGQEVSLWEVLTWMQQGVNPEWNSRFQNRAIKKLSEFWKQVQSFHHQRTKLSLAELYHWILQETGYVEQLKKEETDEADARVQNLEEFDNVLQEFEEANLATPAADRLSLFLEQAMLEGDEESQKKADQAVPSVKMMTVHAAKGLEFPYVFVVGLEEGLFPSVRGEEENDEDIEEERRLFYVAMTRGEKRLYLSYVKMRRIWGQFLVQRPARFIREIPKQYLNRQSYTDAVGSGSGSSYGSGSSGKWKSNWESEDTHPYGKNALGLDSFVQAPASGVLGDHGDDDGMGIGSRVRHNEYGEGTVVALEGSGESQKALIEFRGRVRRKFLVRFVQNWSV